ncbi:hypothetical protein Lal_00008623, partial [Lupinus albus]
VDRQPRDRRRLAPLRVLSPLEAWRALSPARRGAQHPQWQHLAGGAVLRAAATGAALDGGDQPGHVHRAPAARAAGIPGHHRRAHWPAQPARFPPGTGRRPGAHRAQWQAHGGALSGPRRLQAHQRLPRPRCRRPGAAARLRAAQDLPAALRHPRAHGGRRIHRADRLPGAPGGRCAGGREADRAGLGALPHRRHRHHPRRQRRHRLLPECGQTVDGLLRAADIAMYEAKRAGRQQYRFFSPEMNGRAPADLPRQRPPARLRGAAALGAPGRRHGRAKRVHPAAGGDPADQPPGRLDPRAGGQPVHPVARAFRRGPGDQHQLQPGAVRHADPGGRPARGAGDARAEAVADRGGGHRERADAGPGQHPRAVAPAARAGRAHRHRRLRHGLFVARLPAPLRAGHAEDRPAVHLQHAGVAARCRRGQHHHRPGQPPGPGGHRRRGGDPGTARLADRPWLLDHAGLFGLPRAAGGQGGELPAAGGLGEPQAAGLKPRGGARRGRRSHAHPRRRPHDGKRPSGSVLHLPHGAPVQPANPRSFPMYCLF